MSRTLAAIMIFLIAQYQRYISPLTLPSCRFYPTCSNYTVESITKFGPMRGSLKSLGRLMKCNPLFKGGVDLP
ncbi:MAG: membrane protein insertion efficiency factor YidD [Nitrospinota bacterium]